MFLKNEATSELEEVPLSIKIAAIDSRLIANSRALKDAILILLRASDVTKGPLSKEGHRFRTWRVRYFVLLDFFVRYYEEGKADPPFGSDEKGSFPLAYDTILTNLLYLGNGFSSRTQRIYTS